MKGCNPAQWQVVVVEDFVGLPSLSGFNAGSASTWVGVSILSIQISLKKPIHSLLFILQHVDVSSILTKGLFGHNVSAR